MSRRTPVDLAALVAAKKEEEASRARPKYLGVEERAEQARALALERRAREVEEKYRRVQAQQQAQARHHDNVAVSEVRDTSAVVEPPRKKRVRQAGDPRKVKFDWNDEDDTSRPDDPLYNDRQAASLHGRGGPPVNGSHAGYTDALRRIDPERAERVRLFEQRHSARKAAADVHWKDKSLADMKERDWRILKEDFGIQMKGGGAPQPLRRWAESGLSSEMLRTIEDVGYKEPSAIQRATIPVGLAGRDIIGIAETGSGKTASFVLPMLSYIATLPRLSPLNKNGPYAIVLAPTRELAQQIEIETRKFASPLGFAVVSIVGGRAIEEQSWNLRDGAEILIATPGRLLDCLDRHVLVLNQCNYVVMDEADRMVDLGFEQAVNDILDALPARNMKPEEAGQDNVNGLTTASRTHQDDIKYRQTVMFSATMPTAVEKLARKYLRRPVTVVIGNAGQAVETVEQRVEVVEGEDKRRRRLEQVLNSGEFDRPVIVFCATKKVCESLARYLADIGWRAVTLHGGKSQDQREAALYRLRQGQADCLVATDLAGRGIDVPGVTLVLNFTMSRTIEDYIHRIGRTGRAGRKGVALTFVGEQDSHLFYAIKVAAKTAPTASLPLAIRQAVKPNAAILAAAQAAQAAAANVTQDDE